MMVVTIWGGGGKEEQLYYVFHTGQNDHFNVRSCAFLTLGKCAILSVVLQDVDLEGFGLCKNLRQQSKPFLGMDWPRWPFHNASPLLIQM